MVPVLTLIFLIEVLGALNLEWGWVANSAAVLGGLGILLAGWALANRARNRPALARPERVGGIEIAVFVVVPALLPLLFGGQVISAATTMAINLGLLAVIYLVTSYGLFAILRWATRRLFRQVGALFDLLVRTLPLLLLFVTFLFINAEVWQVASGLTPPYLAMTVGMFVLLGLLFMLVKLPPEIGRLAHFDSAEEISAQVEGTPAAPLAEESTEWSSPALSRAQWGNVGLVVLFSQGLQILLVSALIGVFFVGFGLLTISPAIVESWTGGSARVLASFDLAGRSLVLTEELLTVAAFLASFSGLYFTVYALTDPTYRAEFYEQVVADVRTAFAVRAVYLREVA
ncbi:MAG TPA: hypothetical protein VHJ82_03665 [Actinomycetota bacterium]|nr:hypothetical protein [Actinomycetota bacterium]